MRGNSSTRSARSGHEPNYMLIGIIFVLIVFGFVMLSSASLVQGLQQFSDPNYYLKHQLLYGLGLGLPAMFVLSKIDYHIWKKYAFPLMILAIILLLVTAVIGENYLGAVRELNLGGIVVQPSELIKLIFLLYLAVWLEGREGKMDQVDNGLTPFLVMVGFLVFMIAGVQSDLGTTVVITMIAVSAYFVAGAPWKHLAIIAAISVAGLFIFIGVLPHYSQKFAYRADRLTVFMNPTKDPSGASYQVNKALLGIGSGGVLGVGLENSLQKWKNLPQPSTDSIFVVIGEEMGFIVCVGLILLFALFMVQGLRVARDAPELYGKIIATGITTWVIFQAIVNMMAMLALLPLTGIPLPFISYGSTSLITLLASMGILVNISKQTR